MRTLNVRKSYAAKLLWCATLIGALAACDKVGGSSSKPTPAAATEGTQTGTTAAETAAAAALTSATSVIPSGISMTAFPSGSVKIQLGLAPATPAEIRDAERDSVEFRKSQEEKRLKGEGDCQPAQFAAGELVGKEFCYEFDSDMMYGAKSKVGTSTIATEDLYGTRDGRDRAGKHACLVSFGRAEMLDVQQVIDRILGLAQAAACQHRKDNPDFKFSEEKGAPTDVLASLKKAMGDKAGTVKKAEILPEGKTADGWIVYKTHIQTEKDGKESNFYITNAKNPDSESKAFNGLLTIHVKNATDAQMPGKKAHYLANLFYKQSKNSAGEEVQDLEYRGAMFNEDLVAKAMGADRVIDFNPNIETTAGANKGKIKKADNTYYQNNQAMFQFKLVKAFTNLKTEERTFKYAQNPGDGWDESARGMVSKLTKNAAGLLEGVAASGASNSVSIRMSLYDTSVNTDPVQSWHPMFNTSTSPGQSMTQTNNAATFQGKSGRVFEKNLGNQIAIWMAPDDSANGIKFASEQIVKLLTLQKFKRNKDNVYEITSGGAVGYDLVGNGDAGIPPPPPGNRTPPVVKP